MDITLKQNEPRKIQILKSIQMLICCITISIGQENVGGQNDDVTDQLIFIRSDLNQSPSICILLVDLTDQMRLLGLFGTNCKFDYIYRKWSCSICVYRDQMVKMIKIKVNLNN